MHKTMIVLGFLTSAASVAADYEEVRELNLSARGVDILRVDNGAGSIDIVGVADLTDIKVIATLLVPDTSEDRAQKMIENKLKLGLEKDGGTADLVAYFEQRSIFNFGDSPSVSIEIRMPESMHLFVDDGSGSIEVESVRGDVELDDGSGSIVMSHVGGQVEIDDGSGSIRVVDVGGDIYVNDGSGSIDIRGVAGSVTLDDGSGSIDVEDVEKDLILVDDGSGGFDFSNIRGRVESESR